ncbi:MAG: sulfotransferase [Rhodospirillales bacterium]|nr:sulfotransferase [Rhodospirillales bacterium]
MDDAAFSRLADDYLGRLRIRGGRARHVTDKMPSNFGHVGLIRLILLSARIIHVRRNPLDACLSVFANYFNHDYPYAYDLVELGAYYRLYEALMEHWRQVVPGAMLELSYEALIEQPEAEIRRLLDNCNLPFDPACLSFHETKRPVQTSSVSQVRQPLYRKSVERWRNYEAQLKPLGSASSRPRRETSDRPKDTIPWAAGWG